MYEVIAALALLTAPPTNDEHIPDPYQNVAPAMQRVAVCLEILDPREARYILSRAEDFTSDTNLLRRRYQELKDAPWLVDSERFPKREEVNELLAFNRAYRQYIDLRQIVERSKWWEYQTILQETEQLYQIWDTVRDTRCEYYYVTVRRQAMLRLRDEIGKENYYAGILPPYVPLWRFQLLK